MAGNRRVLHPRRAELRAGLAAGLLALSALAPTPTVVLAATPIDGGPLTILPVAINTGAGDQYDPHVSGDIASYTSDADGSIHYYDLFTGLDWGVPTAPDSADQLSDVSNGRIAFSRLDLSTFDTAVELFDIGSNKMAGIYQQPGGNASNSGLGLDTVAYVQDLNAQGELVATRVAGTTTRITDDTRFDQQPQVSPDGSLIVWESCASSPSSCDIHQAAWNGTGWVETDLTNTADPEANPDTDGTTVVYEAVRSGQRDICWQPVGGGAEQCLDLPGDQRNPSIAAGVILFEDLANGSTADLFAYEISTNRLFRITNTPGVDESLSDIAKLSDGRFRIVWTSGILPNRDVYGATVTPPSTDQTPPAVTCDVAAPGPVFVLGGAGGPVSATVADAVGGSGALAASVSAPADVSSVGDKTVSLTGYDVAGNHTTVSCPYRVVYRFGGLLQPVDQLPTLNMMKAGAAVPVKFSLGGNFGLSIFAAGYPGSQTVACDATAPVDGVEETVTAGGSSLSYDATTGLYSYVWKSDKSWTGTCRQLVLKFTDGSVARANFKFK